MSLNSTPLAAITPSRKVQCFKRAYVVDNSRPAIITAKTGKLLVSCRAHLAAPLAPRGARAQYNAPYPVTGGGIRMHSRKATALPIANELRPRIKVWLETRGR